MTQVAKNGTWFERRDYMFDYIGHIFVYVLIYNLIFFLPLLIFLLYKTECGRYLKKTRERHEKLREMLIEKETEVIKKEIREEKRKKREEKEKERISGLCDMLTPPSSAYNTRSCKKNDV